MAACISKRPYKIIIVGCEMSIYKKLMSARIKLQQTELKKSGWNDFSKYNYFELSDYLPTIQDIFNEVGLCGVVSFGAELAELTIFEFEGDGKISITSPMSTAKLKACHEVQNLGAVQTYIRRYLWQSALEIVEHDAVDASKGEELPDYEKQLKTAKNQDELTSVFKSMPKELQLKYQKTATQRKAQLTKPEAA